MVKFFDVRVLFVVLSTLMLQFSSAANATPINIPLNQFILYPGGD
jgi:hypothetical protein